MGFDHCVLPLFGTGSRFLAVIVAKVTCSLMAAQPSISLHSLIPNGCHSIALTQLAADQEKDISYDSREVNIYKKLALIIFSLSTNYHIQRG
jgi:hypothetical protein